MLEAKANTFVLELTPVMVYHVTKQQVEMLLQPKRGYFHNQVKFLPTSYTDCFLLHLSSSLMLLDIFFL